MFLDIYDYSWTIWDILEHFEMFGTFLDLSDLSCNIPIWIKFYRILIRHHPGLDPVSPDLYPGLDPVLSDLYLAKYGSGSVCCRIWIR